MILKELSRRKFIKSVSLTTGSLLVLPQCKFSPKSQWRFFTEEEALLVDAIVEQIIPTDEWSGAKDAKVTNFIDKQLTGPLSGFQERYKSGLSSFMITCQKLHSKQFQELSWDEQTLFLKDLEKGAYNELTDSRGKFENGKIWEKGSDRSFFNLIRSHTMAGYYGSPRHGGNYNNVSYRMLGLDSPVIQGRNKYN